MNVHLLTEFMVFMMSAREDSVFAYGRYLQIASIVCL